MWRNTFVMLVVVYQSAVIENIDAILFYSISLCNL